MTLSVKISSAKMKISTTSYRITDDFQRKHTKNGQDLQKSIFGKYDAFGGTESQKCLPQTISSLKMLNLFLNFI